MKRRLLSFFLTGCLALIMFPDTAAAQGYRADETLYIKARVGLNTYGGDRDDNPDNELSEYIDNIGFSLGGELGYQFTPRFAVGLMHLSGNYPKVSDPRLDVPPPLFQTIDENTTSDWRHHLNLLGRFHFTPRSRVSPYVQLGFHVGFGKINDNIEVGLGPMGGLGLDVAINDQFGLFLEFSSMYSLDDEALDQADPTQYQPSADEDDVSDFDAFNFYGLGLRYTFKPAFTPVSILSIDCPDVLNVGEAGTFTATVNEDATQPVDYAWDFGDNMAAPGLLATHSYGQAGTYTVNFTATNSGSTDTRSCSVRVIAPAEVVTVSSNRTVVDNCEPLTPINFSANVRGTAPITYTWDFGDGSTGTGANPSHIYREAGTYTVTLTTQNDAGTDVQTMTLEVEPCVLACEITDMNSVFFDRNSSVLTPQARAALQENLQIFIDCPTICAEINGYAATNERNARQLALDRARAVQQFYMDGGIDESRFTITGSVESAGKKDTSQLRRADTIPLPCEDMDMDG